MREQGLHVSGRGAFQGEKRESQCHKEEMVPMSEEEQGVQCEGSGMSEGQIRLERKFWSRRVGESPVDLRTSTVTPGYMRTHFLRISLVALLRINSKFPFW